MFRRDSEPKASFGVRYLDTALDYLDVTPNQTKKSKAESRFRTPKIQMDFRTKCLDRMQRNRELL
jgi:hypothetical protein